MGAWEGGGVTAGGARQERLAAPRAEDRGAREARPDGLVARSALQQLAQQRPLPVILVDESFHLVSIDLCA